MVGERGWLPLSTCFLHSSLLPSHWEVVEKGAKKAGKQASRNDWRISREVYIADDGQKARDDALNGPLGKFFTDYWIPLLGSSPRGLAGLKHDPDLPNEALTPEYMLEHLWIVGDPEECAQPYRTTRTPQAGRLNYCEECRVGSAPARNRKQAQRTRESKIANA